LAYQTPSEPPLIDLTHGSAPIPLRAKIETAALGALLNRIVSSDYSLAETFGRRAVAVAGDRLTMES
jgi:hypothetical protein